MVSSRCIFYNFMAECKTEVSPVHQHWRYHSLALSHWSNLSLKKDGSNPAYNIFNSLWPSNAIYGDIDLGQLWVMECVSCTYVLCNFMAECNTVVSPCISTGETSLALNHFSNLSLKKYGSNPAYNIHVFNSLWSSNAIWWHRSRSILMAPSHYLNH